MTSPDPLSVEKFEQMRTWQREVMGNACTVCWNRNMETTCHACGWWGLVPPALTADERVLLEANGWVFATDDHIYIPDDEDGSMANGVLNIRRVLLGIRRRALDKSAAAVRG